MTATITAFHVYIHLADNEYQWSIDREPVSYDVMLKAANEEFAKHPDKPHMTATVLEHGGWALTYYKDGTVVGTANDAAVFAGKQKEIRDMLRGAEWTELPEVWRGR